MTIKNKTAVIFGGTGFIGTQIVRELGALGCRVKVATRVPERAYFLRTCGSVGQVVPVACDYNDAESVRKAVAGCDYVVNCIGSLVQKKRGGFQRAHVEIPQKIAQACAVEGADRFVHISALSAERGTSQYAKSKHQGEQAVAKAFPAATILRPSVVFGPNDRFFNMFAELARFLPALPLIGGGTTKFQPVYVGDVADAVLAALTVPSARGHVFELAGPETVDFRQIYQRIAQYTGRRRMMVPLPFAIAKIEAFFLGALPSPILTRDQVESLKTDNIRNSSSYGLEHLGIMPTEMDVILPEYLSRYKKGGARAKPVMTAAQLDHQKAA